MALPAFQNLHRLRHLFLHQTADTAHDDRTEGKIQDFSRALLHQLPCLEEVLYKGSNRATVRYVRYGGTVTGQQASAFLTELADWYKYIGAETTIRLPG